ncbi:MAG: hypothetical protein IPM64_05440 [Phycisphaerales bacterium]|nr:hypothetical protein [Phycisphaerales bacterium]
MRPVTLSLLALIALAASTSAAVIVVDVNGRGDYSNLYVAVNFAEDHDTIVVMPGEHLVGFWAIGKRVAIRSIDPDNPAVVAATVLHLWLPTLVTSVRIEAGSTLDVAGLTIRGASFSLIGGTVVTDSEVSFRNCIWLDNECRDRSGGAIRALRSIVSLDNCRFLDNRAESGGSAIRADSSVLRLTSCHFEGNLTTFVPRFPEEEHSRQRTIMADRTSVEMTDTTVIGETVYFDQAPSVIVDRCRIRHTAGVQALFIYECPDAVVQSSEILSIGVGPEGGTGCITSGANLRLLGCSIIGGTIGVSTQYPWVLTARGNLYYQNGYAMYVDRSPDSGYYDVRDNCFAGILWGETFHPFTGFYTLPGNLRVDPRVVAPGSWDLNGTPESADDLYTPGDYRLRPDSPLINAGPTDLDYGPDARDFFGRVRVAGGRVDIGFHEYPEPGDLDGDGDLTWFDADPFVLALTHPDAHAAAFPLADRESAGDVNRDGRFDLFDIAPFVQRLLAGRP